MSGPAEGSPSDDEVTLPEDTMKILNEFLLEKLERKRQEQDSVEQKKGKDVNFEENWQLSQFWYSEKTKEDLTQAIKRIAKDNDLIGLLSCPSLYPSIKEVHSKVKIFEFDNRFSSFGDDFVFYDFNQGEDPDYLAEHQNSLDIIIADPPFLSEECIQKISLIIKSCRRDNAKVIFCSGEVVEPWVKNYLSLEKCTYKPGHERNLGNEFVSYANFNLDEFL